MPDPNSDQDFDPAIARHLIQTQFSHQGQVKFFIFILNSYSNYGNMYAKGEEYGKKIQS